MSGKAEDAGAENMQSENMRQDDMRAENAGLESGAAAKLTCGVSVAGVTAACGGSNAKPGAENARAESNAGAKNAAAANAAAESNAGAGEDAESAAGPAAEPDSVSGASGRAPRLRFAGFTEPWQTKKFSDFTYASSVRNKDNLDLVPYAITNEHGFIPQNEAHDEFGYMKNTDRSAYRIVSPDSFGYNPARINIGSIGFYDGCDDVIVSSLYEIFKTDESVDDRFLSYWFKTNDFQNWIARLQEGSVRLYFYYDKLRECKIPVPPSVGEQRQIGMFFSGLDRIIRVQERKTELLRQAKKYFLQNMFPRRGESAPRLRVHGFTQPWQTRKLEDFGSSYGGLSGKNKDDFGHGDASFVTYKNVFLNPVADLDNVGSVEIDLSQNEVRYGDVFFTVSSEIPEEVGMSSVWVGKSENVYLNSFCFGYRPDDESVDPFFMAYMLRSDEVRRKLIFLAQGISRYNISKKAVLKIEVKLPSMEEQRLVGRFFSGLDRIISVQERKTEALRQAKKYYLQNMFA